MALSDVDPAAPTQQALAWLQAKEIVRYERLVQQRHRLEFLLGKWLTRICLSEYTGLAMGDWQFTYNAHGKPQPREGLSVQAPYFNLSHSHGRAVLAVGRTPELGVDIEFTGMKRRVAQIAHRYFADEEIQALLALSHSDQSSRFYELWSLKEAYIKARGLGFAIPLRSFAYSFSPDRLELNEMSRSSAAQWRWQTWQLHTGQLCPGACGAVAGRRCQQKAQSFQVSQHGSAFGRGGGRCCALCLECGVDCRLVFSQ